MSTISKTIDISEFLRMDSEMDSSLDETCQQFDMAKSDTAIASPSKEVHAGNDVQMEAQVSVKMEFSCSPERLCEPNMDYTLDDVIEICSIDDSDDEQSEDGLTSIINTKFAQAAIAQTNSKQPEYDDGENDQLCFVMNDHNYSSQTDSSPMKSKDFANDSRQNVTAEKIAMDSSTEIDEAEKKDMMDFIDNLLQDDQKKTEKIIQPKEEPSECIGNDANSNDPELFLQNVMNEITREDAADEAAEEAHRSSKSNEIKASDDLDSSVDNGDNGDDTDTCSFHSIFDVLTEESTKNKNEDTTSTDKQLSNDNATNAGNNPTETASSSKAQKASEHLRESTSRELQQHSDRDAVNNFAHSVVLPEQSEKSPNEGKLNTNVTSEDSSTVDVDDDNTETVCGANTLDDNVSEPLEVTDFEERFEQFDLCIKESQSSSTKQPILKEITALARDMESDCKQFSTATTDISSRLNSYIVEKLELMRALVKRCGIVTMKDQEQQTEPRLERRRLKKLNKKDKRDLLASTDSSSSSSSLSSSSLSADGSENKRMKKRKLKRRESSNNHKPELILKENKTEDIASSIAYQATQSKINSIGDGIYDDGVNMTKYLRSDVFSAVTIKSLSDVLSSSSAPASSLSSDTSDEVENEKGTKEKSVSEKLSKSKKRRKLRQKDDNDREIERLINLDGLMKRPINPGSTKTSETEKPKSKSSKQKTDEILEFLEKDLAKDTLSSDESVNENEEESITEKQYLERYNADVKRQLLDESSNDSSQHDETDNEFARVLSDESDSGGGNRSPLVEKFLKSYNVEESEDENATPTLTTDLTAANNEAFTNGDKKSLPESQADGQKMMDQKTETKENAFVSDCELLNDNFIYRKRTQPKTLEKILSEAEKRKKVQKLDEDLISLSSESEGSDVEAVDVEPAEVKSRSIKPMLRPDQLHRETLKAQKNETERLRRLDKRQSMLSRVLKEHPDMSKDTELVLDYIDESKQFVKVHPDLVKLLKPHQREGVRFMYDSVYGGVEAVKKSNGSGCILAHCMGLGKTLQLIALMHTVVSYKELKTRKILVLCPKSTVMNWGDEIIRWLYPLATKNLKVYTFSDTSDINEKLEIMREWSSSKRAGCLLVGYEAFRTLVFYHKYKMRHNLDAKRLDNIRDTISNYLLEPGADLVVCDEGHIIKNSKSAISAAVAEIKTQKRIVLTGTPIQNNLKEYYSMVNFIKPLFLGTEKEFANMYANPIKNGQHKDSSKKDIKVMKQRSFVLHKKLSKFVQRKEAELLKTFLPKKFEYVLFVPMTDVQNKLYERILEDINSRTDSRGRSLITDYTCLRKIWTHPKVLEDAWHNAVDRNAKTNPSHSDDDQPDDIYDSQVGFMSVKNDWWRNLIAEKDLESILPSNKLRTMFEILRMCEENGDKCLIFSAFVAVLNVVEYFFQKLTSGDKEIISELNLPPGARTVWEPNKDYFRLDGKTSKSTRHEMIKRFNHPQTTRARVFLISAKAGGQGINLIGANRVIILDTSWNPSNDQQNIFRVFRLGQKKNCYIYRLLAMGTMEEKVYSRSVTKQAMSYRVVDVQQIDRHYSMAELAELYTLTIPKFSERPTPVFPQDNILANLLRSFPDLVYKYHEHDSLLENKVEQELSEQDKIDAWDAYERDLQMNSQPTQMPNMEDLQNRLSQGQMPNYMQSGLGPMALDYQSMLGFRSGLSQAPTSASFMNPLLQQYNNLSNQQYLEILHSLRQYSSGAAGDKSVYNAAVATYANMYGGVVPPVSPHHTSGANITPGGSGSAALHPLNALNDLSMYGLGNSNASATSNPSSLYGATAATSNIPSTAVSAAAGLYANSAAAASYYDQYLQKYAFSIGGGGSGAVGGHGSNNLVNNAAASALSSFANSAAFQTPRRTPPQTTGRKSSTPDLMGFRANVSNIANSHATTATTASASLAASLANLMPSPTMSPGNNNAGPSTGGKSNNDFGNIGNNKSYHRTPSSTPTATNIHQSVPTSIFAATSNTLSMSTPSSIFSSSKATTRPSSSTASTSVTANKNNDAQIRVKDMGQLVANTSRSNPMQSSMSAASIEMSQTKSKTNDNTNSNNNNNRQRQFSSDQSRHLPTKSQTAAEILKARSEMQIIPTTSPPGTASISKQLSEMSPSISLTAVRNNNINNNSNATTKPTTISASNNGKNHRPNNSNNNNSNLTPLTSAELTQRQAQLSSQRAQQQIQQQQAKKPISNATTNVQISNKMATLTKVTTSAVDNSKKFSNTTAKTPLTTPSTSSTITLNNNNQTNKKSAATTQAAVVTQKPGTASALRQQQFRKMPAAVPLPTGASTVMYPSAIQSHNKTTAGTPTNNTKTNNNASSSSGLGKLVYVNNSTINNKKAPVEKQNLPTKSGPNMQGNATKIMTSSSSKIQSQSGVNSRGVQSPTTVRVATSTTTRTTSPTGTAIVRKPAFTNSNSSGLQISAVSNYNNTIKSNSSTSLAASITTKIPSTSTTAVSVQLLRSNSALSSGSRSFSPATAATSKPTKNNATIRPSQSTTVAAGTTITPKITNVTSLNTASSSTNPIKPVKTISNMSAIVASPAALKRSATSVQLNAQSLKILQDRRFASSTAAGSAAATTAAVKTAAATSTLMQQKQRLSNAGSTLAQTTPPNQQQKNPMQRAISVRQVQKPTAATDNNMVTQAISSRSAAGNLQGIPKFILDRKRKSSDIGSKDSGISNKRPKDF